MSDISFDKEGKIAVITLNRPEVRNAFTIEMVRQWADALEEYRRDDSVDVVVLTGAGQRAFCSGIDLNALQGMREFKSIKSKSILWDVIHQVAFALERLDKPMICAVNGAALGAGMDMALMCDIRFASENASFAEGYIKFALVPGDGGAYFLPRIVGMAKALELLWTGDLISAQEAKEFGIVNRIISAKELMPRTMEFAERLSNSPKIAIRMIKRAVYQSQNCDLRTALDLISSHMVIVHDTKDHEEALSAIMEKRTPHFTGS